MVSLDESVWPAVVVRFPVERPNQDHVERFIAGVADIAARGEPYGLVIDMSQSRFPLSAAQSSLIDDFVDDNHEALASLTLGTAIVSDSLLVRGLLTAYHRSRQPPAVCEVFPSVDDGVRWIHARSNQCRRPASVPPVALRRDSRSARVRELTVLVDLFDQPAFVVTAGGKVMHANPAAVQRFGAPPPWVSRAVTCELASLPPMFRLAAFEADDGLVYVLAPDDRAAPVDGLDRRLRVPLPPSLRLVAEALARGLSDKEIAQETGRTLATVRTYVRRVYRKLEVSSRAELIALFSRRGRDADRAP